MVWALVGVVPGLASGGAGQELRQEFSLRRWTTVDGLPSDQVLALAQTRDGYLWVGTRDGLARFDGMNFTVLHRGNTAGLPGNAVARLAEDAAGGLWVAGEGGGVARLGDGRWESRGRLGGGGPMAERWVGQDHGAIWRRTEDGPWRREGVRADDGAPDRLPAAAAHPVELPGGTLWYVEDGVLVCRPGSGGTERRYPLPPGLDAPVATAAAVAPDGGLWWLHRGARPGGDLVLQRTGEAGSVVVHRLESGPGVPSMFLVADRAGRLWLSRGALGLGCWQGDTLTTYAPPWTREEDVALCLLEDREGNLWLGTENSGLYRLTPRLVRMVDRSAGLPDAAVRAVCPRAAGGIWVGTDRGVVAWLPNGRPEGTLASSHLVSGMAVRALAEGRDGDLWIGTTRGVFRWTEGGTSAVALPSVVVPSDRERVGSQKVRAILATRRGEVWIATAQALGVLPAGDRRPRLVAVAPGSVVTSLLEDREGRIWFGTEARGVGVISASAAEDMAHRLPPAPAEWTPPGTDQFFVEPEVWWNVRSGLSSDHVWGLFEDSTGVVWIACENGLNRLADGFLGRAEGDRRQEGPMVFAAEHGLIDYQVNSMVEDDRGFLWLGVDRGILRVALADLAAVAEGRRGRVVSTLFGEADGMTEVETHGRVSHPGACRDAAGGLWFATGRGVVGLEPSRLEARHPEPRVVLEEVRVDDQRLWSRLPWLPSPVTGVEEARTPEEAGGGGVGGEIRLRPGRARILEFRFAALNLTAPERCRFRHRLVGFREDWREADGDRVAFFTGLRPGRYRFEVMAANHHGVWSAEPAVFAFRLTPHFWQTRVFQGVTVMLVLGVAVGVGAWRVREVRRRAREEQQLALWQERASIAHDLHDDLGPRLTELSLLTGVAMRGAGGSGEGDRGAMGRIAGLARDLARTLEGMLWIVEPTGDTLGNFAARVREYAAEFLGTSGLELRVELPGELPQRRLTRALKRQVFLAVKELLNNVVRHASASVVHLRLRLETAGFILEIADNGRGFSPAAGGGEDLSSGSGGRGMGLVSLRERAAAVGGTLEICSEPGTGTRVRLSVPWDGGETPAGE